MTPQRRRNIIIAVIVVALLIIALILWFLLRGGDGVEEPIDEGAIPTETIIEAEVADVEPATAGEASAETVAKNFVERFGTYSSDVAFTNVEEVQELSTASYYSVLQGQVFTVPDNTEYSGRTTRAISTTLIDGSEELGRMVFEVTVQNELASGTRANASIEYTTATITVVKQGEDWLVDGFQWGT